MVVLLRWLLLPFSILYDIVTRVRNFCFDKGWFKSRSYKIPVICIGNITVGGTGKTPHTEYLAKLLMQDYSVTMISRGYMRKTKGVVVATDNSTAKDIGDEPFQMLKKFNGLNVIVSEKRVQGIEAGLSLPKAPDVILLDDAFQHRHVKPGLSVLLIDYNRPIWNDYLIPTGNLRESFSSIKRADIIIITKCPSGLSVEGKQKILRKLKPFDPENVYFSSFKYGNPYSFAGSPQTMELSRNSSVVVVSGIANPKPLHRYLETVTSKIETIVFPDHHHFTGKDIRQICLKFDSVTDENKIIITTEKDAVRLKDQNLLPQKIVNRIWILPIEVEFLFNGTEKFNRQIIEYVR